MNYYDPNSGGADCYYRHPIYQMTFTNTIKDFCEDYKCYWILDVIGSYYPKMKKYDFLLLAFDVNSEECTFTAREDSGEDEVFYQFIDYTDLSVSVKFYFENDVLMFPGDR